MLGEDGLYCYITLYGEGRVSKKRTFLRYIICGRPLSSAPSHSSPPKITMTRGAEGPKPRCLWPQRPQSGLGWPAVHKWCRSLFTHGDIGSSHSWILMPSVASVKTIAGGSSSRLHRRSPWQQQSTTYSTQWRTQHVKWRVNVPIWCLAIDWIADTFPGQLNMRRLDWLSCMSTLAVVMADVRCFIAKHRHLYHTRN